MRRFLVRLMVFCGIVTATIGGLCALEIACEIHAYHRELIMDPQARILVCGDSQTSLGIDPGESARVCNFSASGRALDQSMFVLRDVLDSNIGHFTIVLIDVSPTSAANDYHLPISTLELGASYWLVNCLHFAENRRSLSGLVKIVRDNLVGKRFRKFSRALRGKENFASALKGGFQRVDGCTRLTNHDGYMAMIENKVRRTSGIGKLNITSPVFELIDEMIVDVRAHGAEAVLITTPWDENLRGRFVDGELQRFTETISAYAQSRNCIYLDFLCAHFDVECWRDANHLNFRGAKQLTEMIMGELTLRFQ